MDAIMKSIDSLLDRVVNVLGKYKWWLVAIAAIAGILFVYLGSRYE